VSSTTFCSDIKFIFLFENNRDGTALYEAVAALFIAQLRNKSLTLGKIVAVR